MVCSAVESVIGQSVSCWELIIVDDGSDDGTDAVISNYLSDKRIRYKWIDHRERSAARNCGIEMARGEYICFLDSDDYYLPNHLKVLRDEIARADEEMMFVTLGKVQDGDQVTERCPFDGNVLNQVLRVWHRRGFPIGCVCVKRDVLQVDRFDNRFFVWEDYHLWFRILSREDARFINRHTYVEVEHEGRSFRLLERSIDEKFVETFESCVLDLFSMDIAAVHLIGRRQMKLFLFGKILHFYCLALPINRNASVEILRRLGRYVYDMYSLMSYGKQCLKLAFRSLR